MKKTSIRQWLRYTLLSHILSSAVRATVLIRGEDSSLILGSNECNFSSAIVISLPSDLYQWDTQFSISSMQLKAVWLILDYINNKRCGVHLPDGNASLLVRAYADSSSKEKVKQITNILLTQNESNFYLGPYSSSLVMEQAKVTDSRRKVLISGGAADTAIFLNRSFTFGTLPPVNNYMVSAFEMLSQYGVQTVATFWEDASFTKGACGSIPDLASRYEMSLIFAKQIRASPNETDLYPISEVLKKSNPDVVIACVYESACDIWIRAMRLSAWSPKAQIFTVCLGLSTFEAKAAADAEYMIGVTPWDKSLSSTGDITNWTPATFNDEFIKYSGSAPTYHAASAAASLSILAQAIEIAGLNWSNSEVIAKVIRDNFFPTIYGNISFDSNGQSTAPVHVIQYQKKLALEIVYPYSLPSSSLVYPMPSWGQRDCQHGRQCEGSETITRLGTCTIAGTCDCLNSMMVTAGVGLNATCIPAENMNFIPTALTAVGTLFVTIQGFLSVCCIIWTKYFEKRASVQASQPFFLILIALGSFVLVSSIIPLGIQGTYRYILDPITHEQSEYLNPDIRRLDAACMAWPWLYFLGFSLMFSSLFAKLWRIRALFQSGQAFKRRVVTSKDVLKIIIIMVGLNFMLLLIWQLVKPLQWQRTIIQQAPLSSVGECKPVDSWGWFLLMPLIILEVFLLIVALVVSYQVRKVPSTLAEKKWIAITIGAICEIFILSVPVLAIARDNTSAFYFVRVTVIFLQGFTATLLIFVPKIYNLHYSEEARKSPTDRFKRTSTPVERNAILHPRRSTFIPLTQNGGLSRCQLCLSRDTAPINRSSSLFYESQRVDINEDREDTNCDPE